MIIVIVWKLLFWFWIFFSHLIYIANYTKKFQRVLETVVVKILRFIKKLIQTVYKRSFFSIMQFVIYLNITIFDESFNGM